MSGLLSQLMRDGFQPTDPTLFDSAISSLSSAISNQTQTASALTDFRISKRRESYLSHASLPLCSAEERIAPSLWAPVQICLLRTFTRRFLARLRRIPLSSPPCPWPNLSAPNRRGGVSLRHPPDLLAPLKLRVRLRIRHH